MSKIDNLKRPEITKNCIKCNSPFTTTNHTKKYCSDQCRAGAVCVTCGINFIKRKGTTGSYCSKNCWYKYYDQVGIKTKECPVCKKQFHGTNITCSKECGFARVRSKTERAKECKYCKKPLNNSRRPKQIYCDRHCSARDRKYVNGMPRCSIGDKRLHGNGYVKLKISEGNGKSDWVLEHRYVIEQSIGRKLTTKEYVHHKDGDRTNNNLDNLELWHTPTKKTKKDPCGQRTKDLLASFKKELVTVKDLDEALIEQITNLAAKKLFRLEIDKINS